MARVNVYLPDELARQAKAAHLNISNVTQEALKRKLGAQPWQAWLDKLRELPPVNVSHEDILNAIDEAREESGNWETRDSDR